MEEAEDVLVLEVGTVLVLVIEDALVLEVEVALVLVDEVEDLPVAEAVLVDEELGITVVDVQVRTMATRSSVLVRV